MCTMISTQVAVAGCGKGAGGWFDVFQASVSYDHPFSAPLEHALNIDFVNQALGPGARVAVELSAESARALVRAITAVLAQAEAGGYLDGAT
jgi:Family of unknown function (DUF6295)